MPEMLNLKEQKFDILFTSLRFTPNVLDILKSNLAKFTTWEVPILANFFLVGEVKLQFVAPSVGIAEVAKR